jgi:hypothetical protein
MCVYIRAYIYIHTYTHTYWFIIEFYSVCFVFICRARICMQIHIYGDILFVPPFREAKFCGVQSCVFGILWCAAGEERLRNTALTRVLCVKL